MIARQNTRFWCSASCVHFTTRVVPIDTEFRELFGSVQKTIAIAVAVELFTNDPIAQFAVLGVRAPPRPCCHFCLFTANYINHIPSSVHVTTVYTHNHQKFAQQSKSIISTTMANIEAALAAMRSDDAPVIAEYAAKYNCNRSTLSRRYRGITTSREAYRESKSLLTNQQSTTLVEYINTLTARGLSLTPTMVRNFMHNII